MVNRLERAQIASLALLARRHDRGPELEYELLKNAGVYHNVVSGAVTRCDSLLLASDMPQTGGRDSYRFARPASLASLIMRCDDRGC